MPRTKNTPRQWGSEKQPQLAVAHLGTPSPLVVFPQSSCLMIFHSIFLFQGWRAGTINYFRGIISILCVLLVSPCFLQRTWREVKSLKQQLHFSSVLFQIGMWLWCQAYSSAAVVTTDQSQPACRLGAGCHQISQVPFALAPGGETSRNGLEIFICNSVLCTGSRELWGPVLYPLPPSASLEESMRWKKFLIRLHFH